MGFAQDGRLVIDLAPISFNVGGLLQNVATVASQAYTLRFWGGTSVYAGRTGTGIIDVSIDGGAAQSFGVANNQNAIVWQQFTHTFTATSALTKIQFSNSQNGNLHFAFLDDVGLAPVPGPATMALAAAGLAIAARRRARRA